MPAMMFAALATMLLTASPASAQLQHADEISFFAKTMAIASTVTRRMASMEAMAGEDTSMLDEIAGVIDSAK